MVNVSTEVLPRFADREVTMRLKQPGWKAKNVLTCETHKDCVDMEKFIELFPYTAEGKGFDPDWRAPTYSPGRKNRTAAEYLRSSFSRASIPVKEKAKQQEKGWMMTISGRLISYLS